MSYSIASNNVITLTRGDSFYATVDIYNGDGKSKYVPQIGDKIRFALKKDIKDTECLILKEIPIDTLVLHLEPEDTKQLLFGEYIYDIQLTKANGDVDTFITKNKFKITEEVE